MRWINQTPVPKRRAGKAIEIHTATVETNINSAGESTGIRDRHRTKGSAFEFPSDFAIRGRCSKGNGSSALATDKIFVILVGITAMSTVFPVVLNTLRAVRPNDIPNGQRAVAG
jgi:hypothetical protein